MPFRPAASIAAPTRYGLQSPVGARFSMCRDADEPLLMRRSAVLSSGPHEMFVGLNVCVRRRFMQLTVGASSV